MKKNWVLMLVLTCMLIINVKAENALPKVISYKAMITNKEGAICYDANKSPKENIIVPYKTIFDVENDVVKGLVLVVNNDYDCYVKTDDLGAMDSEFSLDNKNIEKLNSLNALVLADNGLNLRKGPATSFRKIVTIPGKTKINLLYKAGTYWYYIVYNDNTGWITSMDQYLGIENTNVLVSNTDTNIYNSKKKIIGKIPANKEISVYLELVRYYDDDPTYFVKYNNVEGYIGKMYYKTKEDGVIRLVNDIDIKDENGIPTKKLSKDQELTYTMKNDGNGFYFSDKNLFLELNKEDYVFVKEAKLKIKETGYLGEGLFGEAKEEVKIPNDEEEEEAIEVEPKEESEDLSMGIMVIIGFVCGILFGVIFFLLSRSSNKTKDDIEKAFEEKKNKY